VLNSLDQLIFKLKIVFAFVTKQATLMRRSTVLSLPLQFVFPVQDNGTQHKAEHCYAEYHLLAMSFMLSVIYKLFCTECGYAECHYAEHRYAECRYAECHYAECHYAECRYAECRSASHAMQIHN
jgi:hypothetical protein